MAVYKAPAALAVTPGFFKVLKSVQVPVVGEAVWTRKALTGHAGATAPFFLQQEHHVH